MNPEKQRATMSAEEKQRIVADFERYVNRGQSRYLRAGHLDVIETKRKGIGFVDPESGRVMTDCFTAAGCFNVGRHNPQVMAALDKALATMDLGTPGMVSQVKLDFARKLLSLAPEGLDRMLPAAGGGDAVDGALKLAMGATGRTGVASTVKAYHGHTGFALSANGKEHYRHYCEPLMPGFRFVPFNDLAAMERIVDRTTAAVIVEPIQGEAGIFVGEPAYLQGLRALCDRTGAMLVFDEIQTGFGRSGKLFACQHSGVKPDIMTVAKSIAGGLYPNAAILYRGDNPALADFITRHPDFHPSATGGSDLGCAVGLAVLDYLEEHRLWENAEAMGALLKEALLDLKARMPQVIKEVRGQGLMLGVEYIHEFMGPMMSDALAKQGIFAVYSGNAPQVMRFMVPITVTRQEMESIIAAIKAAIDDLHLLLPVAMTAARVQPLRDLLNDTSVQITLFNAIRAVEDWGSQAVRLLSGRNK